MLTIYLSPFVALIGVLLYALSSNPKAQEIGRILFFVGALVSLLTFGHGDKIHIP